MPCLMFPWGENVRGTNHRRATKIHFGCSDCGDGRVNDSTSSHPNPSPDAVANAPHIGGSTQDNSSHRPSIYATAPPFQQPLTLCAYAPRSHASKFQTMRLRHHPPPQVAPDPAPTPSPCLGFNSPSHRFLDTMPRSSAVLIRAGIQSGQVQARRASRRVRLCGQDFMPLWRRWGPWQSRYRYSGPTPRRRRAAQRSGQLIQSVYALAAALLHTRCWCRRGSRVLGTRVLGIAFVTSFTVIRVRHDVLDPSFSSPCACAVHRLHQHVQQTRLWYQRGRSDLSIPGNVFMDPSASSACGMAFDGSFNLACALAGHLLHGIHSNSAYLSYSIYGLHPRLGPPSPPSVYRMEHFRRSEQSTRFGRLRLYGCYLSHPPSHLRHIDVRSNPP
ncbi:hypothetical protein B0H16DRAFT_154894 [Mycena metata]|uniref:Uncharacterized protein n=1 Tax=Mycena metata TaxID=1033252 RepID=A0AAD7MV27_9AGAR|nr:hypothetical protein B0H16DRAFT_154894 [Mycena metata]